MAATTEHPAKTKFALNGWRGLERGFQAAGVNPRNRYDVEVPLYGKTLDELTEALRSRVSDTVEKGEAGADQEVDEFTALLIEDLAKRAGVQPADARALLELGAIEKGPERWRWVKALAQSTAQKAPWLADLGIARFTTDVHAYLTRPHVQQDVNSIVAPAIGGGTCIVLAHSLGTVVAYVVLTEAARNPQVKLLVTAGSPLGIRSIKAKLRRPLNFPGGVQRWFNAADESDIIALYSRLDIDSFIAQIDNYSEVNNGDSPHAMSRYLENPKVATEIAQALS